jgi:hypothetical protein
LKTVKRDTLKTVKRDTLKTVKRINKPKSFIKPIKMH